MPGAKRKKTESDPSVSKCNKSPLTDENIEERKRVFRDASKDSRKDQENVRTLGRRIEAFRKEACRDEPLGNISNSLPPIGEYFTPFNAAEMDTCPDAYSPIRGYYSLYSPPKPTSPCVSHDGRESKTLPPVSLWARDPRAVPRDEDILGQLQKSKAAQEKNHFPSCS